MRKILFLSILISSLSLSVLSAAPKSSKGKGRVLPLSTVFAGAQRWYLVNEGNIGLGYSRLGDTNLLDIDLGLSAYITKVTSKFDGFSPIFGLEVNVPIYVKAFGPSNLYTTWPAAGLSPDFYQVLGVGIEVPFFVGLQWDSFYLRALLGYAYNYVREQYTLTAGGAHPIGGSSYHGLIYGLSTGWRVSNLVSLGLRYISGDMESVDRFYSDPRNGNPPQPQPQQKAFDFLARLHHVSFFVSVAF